MVAEFMDSDRSGDEGFKGRFSGISGGGGKSGIPAAGSMYYRVGILE